MHSLRRIRPSLHPLETRRLLSGPGTLDATFNGDGRQMIDFSGLPGAAKTSAATGVVVQADGKVVVAGDDLPGTVLGGLYPGSSSILVARLNADGSPDGSFGTGGKAAIALPSAATGDASVMLAAGGKIVVVDSTFNYTAGHQVYVARLNADGSPDTAFDSDGLVVVGGFRTGTPVVPAQTADGRIVLVGEAADMSSPMAMRLNADGSIDKTFGTGGVVRFATPANAASAFAPSAVAIQPDGRIVVGLQEAFLSFGPRRFAAARLGPDGGIDTAFGAGGLATVDFGDGSDNVAALALDGQGRIVLAGAVGSSFGVARLNADGSVDATFDSDGRATVSFGATSAATAVAVDGSGNIVLGGWTGSPSPLGIGTVKSDFAAARLTAAGALDPAFGAGGKATVDFSSIHGADDPDRNDQAFAMAVQKSDGMIVLAGSSFPAANGFTTTGAPGQFAVARLDVAPAPGDPGQPTPPDPGKPTPPGSCGGTGTHIYFFYGLKRPAMFAGRAPASPPPAPSPTPVAKAHARPAPVRRAPAFPPARPHVAPAPRTRPASAFAMRGRR